MKLYEIDQQILDCIDSETGELIDPERLSALMMERDAKIEGVALWVKNLESEVLALKAEKDAFAERERVTKSKVERLKKWLSDALGGQKFSTTKCAVSFRRSLKTEILDADSIPTEYLKVKTEPDVTAIKNALKDGQEVPGCQLIENQNISIK